MGKPQVRRPRGRPPDLEKRRDILEAATRLFLAQGYAGTSLDAVAEAAGVSKLTVYSHFGHKDGLFREMVRARCDAYNRPEGFERLPALAPREALRRIGRNFLALVLSPETLRLYRMMTGEAGRQPTMARLFFEAGPERLGGLVAEYLRRAAAQGHLEIADPLEAADAFLSLLKGALHFRATLGLERAPTARAIDVQVERAVEIFLRAYAPARRRRARPGRRRAASRAG